MSGDPETLRRGETGTRRNGEGLVASPCRPLAVSRKGGAG